MKATGKEKKISKKMTRNNVSMTLSDVKDTKNDSFWDENIMKFHNESDAFKKPSSQWGCAKKIFWTNPELN